MKKFSLIFIGIISLMLITLTGVTGCKNEKILNVYFYENNNLKDIIKVDYGESLTDIPEVSNKKGYTGKWSVENFTNIVEDLKVNAIYTPNTYTITYDYNDATNGNDEQSKDVTYDDEIGTLPQPTLNDFKFDGWYYNDTLITVNTIYTYNTNITIKAKWIKLYTVTFLDNDETIYQISVEENTVLPQSELENIQVGENFDYWLLDGNKFNFNTLIVSNITLTAKYIIEDKKTLNVYFYENNNLKDIVKVDYGESLTDIPEISSKKGYTGKWSVENFTNIVEDLKVNAIYTPNTYTITYNYNGATSGNNEQSKDVTYDDEVGTLPQPTLNDFKFDGWYYNDTLITVNTIYNYDTNITIKAKWIKQTFEDNGCNIISTDNFTIENKEYKLLVDEETSTITLNLKLKNIVENFDFRKKFNVSANCFWRVYEDESLNGVFEITTRIAQLEPGMNTFYIFVENMQTYENKTYTINLYRNQIYTAEYYAFGDKIEEYTENVEEDTLIPKPSYVESGVSEYNQTGWTLTQLSNNLYDFNNDVITENLKFYACFSDSNNYDNIVASLDGKNAIITDIKDKVNEIYIPEIYYTNIVTDISENAFSNYTDLVKITLPKSITSINKSTFSGCSSLTSIQLPNSITSIGNSAFSGCSGLESITLPFVGDKAHTSSDKYQYPFGYIFGTNSYTGGVSTTQYYRGSSTSSTTNSTYYIPSTLKKAIIIGSTYVAYGAFSNCSSLESIQLPNSVTSIAERAFYYCSGLKSIQLPNSVTSIGVHAFYNCSSLTSVELSNSLTSINNYSFADCNNLTSINIPNGVTSIGKYAFKRCSSLTSIQLPNSVTSIDENTFDDCNSLNKVIIDNISSFAQINFANIFSNPLSYAMHLYLSSDIENEITEITAEHLNDCTKISSYAFISCISLTSIQLSNSVTSIDEMAFYYCSGLTSITISNSVKNIGMMAFVFCSNLENITIPNSVTNIGNMAFYGCDKLQYTEGNLIYIKTTNNNYFALFGTTSTDITSATINSNCKFILSEAFSGCSSLESITIPNSVINIGSYAFNGCDKLKYTEGNLIYIKTTNNNHFALCDTTSTDITSATINSNCKFILNEAFASCSNLTSIQLPNSVTNIGGGAFYNCSSLTSIQLPNSVTSIDYMTFEGCSSLTSIQLPSSVTSIGKSAFDGCSSLTSITFDGTKAQWNSIPKGSEWDLDTGNYIIYCTDGNISK